MSFFPCGLYNKQTAAIDRYNKSDNWNDTASKHNGFLKTLRVLKWLRHDNVSCLAIRRRKHGALNSCYINSNTDCRSVSTYPSKSVCRKFSSEITHTHPKPPPPPPAHAKVKWSAPWAWTVCWQPLSSSVVSLVSSNHQVSFCCLWMTCGILDKSGASSVEVISLYHAWHVLARVKVNKGRCR